MAENYNCDGSGPHRGEEVRKLPIGSIPDYGNLILCKSCFEREMAWRRERNQDLATEVHFKLPQWEELTVYQTGKPTPP